MVDVSLCIILFYYRDCRYSVNVLVSALESKLKHVKVLVVDENSALVELVNNFSRQYRTVIVGFSLLTTMIHKLLFRIKLLAEFRRNNVILIAGGPHATGDPVGTLNLGFDFVFFGESEKSLVEFVEALAERNDPFKVKGIIYRMDDEYFFTGKREPIVLNKYPPFPYWRRRFNPMEISRGCPFQCGYCQTPYIHGFLMRHRSVENIVYYADVFWKHGLRDLRFISPNSLAYGSVDGVKPRFNMVEEVLSKLKAKAKNYGGRIFFGTFPSEVRPEFVTEESIRILRKYVDNKRIIIGAQSGSEKILKILRRGHTVGDVIEATEIAFKYGFKVDVDFIFGLPYESEDDIKETIRVMEKLVRLGARIHAHTFLPLPGTPLETAPPGRIPKSVKKFILKISGKGKVYGEWIKQERLAQIIDEYRKKGIIKPRDRWKIKFKHF